MGPIAMFLGVKRAIFHRNGFNCIFFKFGHRPACHARLSTLFRKFGDVFMLKTFTTGTQRTQSEMFFRLPGDDGKRKPTTLSGKWHSRHNR
jgi:hypothetical protein